MANPTTKNLTFGSVLFSLEGLRKIFVELSDIVREQGELEISQLAKNEDQSEEEFKTLKDDFRENAFRLLATVNFEDGTSIHTSDPGVLHLAPSGPLIQSVYLSNITPFKHRLGVEPEHRFELYIDLRQPALFDASEIVSSPTPNFTNLSISGSRSGWRSGIEEIVRKHIIKHRPVRSFLHSGFIYDLFLMVFGLPLAFYFCWLSSGWITTTFSATNNVVISAVYVYVAFCAIWFYRFLFSYSKWAFPLVEITDQATRPAKHRKIWWAIIITLAAKLFWDLTDPYISLTRLWTLF
ncbi:hypothetical protein [Hoeflea sp. EC-HK425]|uniref:hypothetical protein n=1 Tax=Hoeflea sp. EC-HK425 TaxID=2038388 RepID=UPI001254E977|nr:hypothetical protein [Hoeflea sp. EC-HK425]VVT19038.1 conserved membrane hypothetical protein [Hoeflea sp. EC-HK425]|tara:strand:- start:412 stop:1296 length:885 start_codon:yes stop_codon:yes gene_type:complete